MIRLQQNPVRYFCSVVLVLLLSQVAVCVEDSIGINFKPNSSSPPVSTISSAHPSTSESNGTRSEVNESIEKQTISRETLPDKTTTASLSHGNTRSNTGLPQHSTDAAVSPTQHTINNTIASSVKHSTSAGVNNVTTLSTESHPPSVAPTVPIHRKSKPEETTVDKVVRDSGPTTDYVVPLVIAMLAVPLVGVLCALMYMKGRDFWERRHYGRIDFLWDSRNDSRMDFLIDGMYNN